MDAFSSRPTVLEIKKTVFTETRVRSIREISRIPIQPKGAVSQAMVRGLHSNERGIVTLMLDSANAM